MNRRFSMTIVALTVLCSSAGAFADNECSPYGINTHLPSQSDLDLIHAAGFDWVRFDFNWFQLEPSKGNYNWGPSDSVVNKAHALGLNIFPTISYTPQWAAANKNCIPGQGKCEGCNTQPFANVQDWKDFVGAVVNRYKDKVKYWGLWNEPNLDGFYCGSEDQYVNDILIPGAQVVHSLDPSAKVCGPELAGMTKGDEWHGDDGTCLFGGCILNGWELSLAGVLDKGGDHIDIITHHFYSKNAKTLAAEVLDGEFTVIKTHSSLKEIVEGHGQGQPVWLTEWGWNTHAYGGYSGGGDDSPANQAAWSVQFYDIQQQIVEGTYGDSSNDPWPQFQKLFLYDWHDGVDGEGKLWSFGIVEVDGTPKPAYAALKDYFLGNPPTCGGVDPGSKGPVFSAVPDIDMTQGKGRPHAVDLHDYAADEDTPLNQLIFSIAGTDAGDCKIAIANGHFLSIIPENNWTGGGSATVQVSDGSKSDTVQIAFNVALATKPQDYPAPLLEDLAIDANVGDWDKALPVYLDSPEDWCGLAGANPADSDLQAIFKAAWSDGFLYLAVDVTDDVQSNNYAPDAIWMGDGIQIAIDSEGDKNGPGYDGNDWELGVALTADGNQVFCWHVPNGVQGCPVLFDISRQGSKTTYEMRITGDFADTLGLNVLVNDDDGAGREGWLEWTPGIGLGKNPGLFGTVKLVDTAPPIPVDNQPGEDVWTAPDQSSPAEAISQPDTLVPGPDHTSGPEAVTGADGTFGPGTDGAAQPDEDGAWVLEDGDKGDDGCTASRLPGPRAELILLSLLFLLAAFAGRGYRKWRS